jgi:hypothetical protein
MGTSKGLCNSFFLLGSASDGGDLIQESDDDDAPEAVSFTSGRESALTAVKSAMDQIKKNKDCSKEKRRKQDEQYKKQKVCEEKNLEQIVRILKHVQKLKDLHQLVHSYFPLKY